MNRIRLGSLEQAITATTKKLSEIGKPKIAFVGQRASDFLLFKNSVQIDLVASVDFGQDAEIIEKTLPVVSLEKFSGVRKNCYSGEIKELFSNSRTIGEVKKNLPAGSLLIPYTSTPELESFAEENTLTVLAPKSSLKNRLGSKLTVFNIKEQLGLTNPSVVLTSLNQANYSSLSKKFGQKFVAQTENGSSGSGTFIIQSEETLEELKFHLTNLRSMVIITRFIDGPTISINGVITPRQTVFLPPSYQVIGNPETALKPSVFSGVDFTSAKELVKEKDIFNVAGKITASMRAFGFLGAFNLNLMADGLILTDINPRFMGSGQFCTQLQLENKEIPFSLLQLMTFLGIDFEIDLKEVEKIAQPKNGSLIILHSLESGTKSVTGNLELGVYKPLNGGLLFQRQNLEADSLGNQEVLIAGAIPQTNKSVESSAPLLRITAREPVLDPKTLKLNVKFKNICQEIYQKLNLS